MASKSSSTKKNKAKGNYDWGLLAVVVTLLTVGLIMVFSSSYAQGIKGFDDPFFFIMRQIMWTALGVAVMAAAARIDYSLWERLSIPLMGASLGLLLLLIPVGVETFGATRTFFNGSIQPSELAKVVIIIYVSAWLASKGERIRDVRVGLLPFSVLMGIVTVLIVTQPDISTAILIVTTASVMLFIAGAKVRQLIVIGIGVSATFAVVIRYSSYASDRVAKYVASFQNPLESAEWQARHSVQAFIAGGPVGTGIGNSVAKLGYLPVSWSDNIFAIIGEELGLLGALFVILLFALFAYRGLHIAMHSPDSFGTLLATGITSLIILQALLNTAVVVAVAPATGVTLPFISYGGSSLVTVLAAVGILLSISRYSAGAAAARGATGNMTYARFNFGWRDGGARVSGPSRRRKTQTGRKKQGTGKAKSRKPARSSSRSRTGTSRKAASRTGSNRSTSSRSTGSRRRAPARRTATARR